MKRAFLISMLLFGGMGVVVACGGDDESPPPSGDAGTDATLDQGVDTGIDTGVDAAVDVREGGTTLDGGACGGDPVVITSVVPQFAWKDGRTALTITGTGFIATPKVYLRDATGKLTQLQHVGFVSSTSITAVIPAGTFTAGTYEVAVVNANTCADTIAGGIRIVDQAPPLVLTVAPAAGTTQNDVEVTITGCHFDANATVSTVSSAGAVVAMTTTQAATCDGAPTEACGGANLCTMKALVKTKTAPLTVGAYLVRVTNPTPNTWGEYATFVVTNPAGNLGTWTAASSLVTGRRSLALVAGRADDANRFLYAIGGENAGGTALDTVEVGPLDRFGQLGKWSVARSKLTVPRSGAAAVRHGRWIYVLGGTSAVNGTKRASPTGAVLRSIERAPILDPSGAPKLTDPPTIGTGGSLAKGTWYYQVSAIGGDANNPGGESIASDEVVATVDANGKVTLTWSAVAGATGYRVYRSQTADATSGSEVLIATTDGATTSFVDTGAAADGGSPTVKPLGAGALGLWQSTADAIGGRSNASAVVATDPNGDAYLYLIGGWGTCTSGATALTGCIEVAKINGDGTLGTFTTTTSLAAPRMRHEAAVLAKENGPSAFSDAGTPETAHFVVVGGGYGAPTSVEFALVQAGGGLGAFTTAGTSFKNQRDGLQVEIANGYMFAFQGGDFQTGYTQTAEASKILMGNSTLTFDNWNNAGGNLGGSEKVARHGITAESAYFYMVGGTSNDNDALATVRQVLH